MYNSSSVSSVNYQARTLISQSACTDKHRFLSGTCSLHDINELSLLQYFEESNHTEVSCIFNHPDQVLALESSPEDPSLILTSHQNQSCFKTVSLWRIPLEILDEESGPSLDRIDLREITSFNSSQKMPAVSSISWNKSEDKILLADQKILSCWELRESSVEQSNAMILGFDGSTEASESTKMRLAPPSITWDPHNSRSCVVGFDSTLQVVDTREMEVTHQCSTAHKGFVRNIDYNPNKAFTFLSCGDDRLIKFWDLRRFDQPVMTLCGHSHWVLTAKYNPFHDQLVLSGGSDNLVNLWRVASCSSSPWIGGEDNDDDPPDVKVRAMDQHEDTVYAVAWSAADAWIYASMSFDGRMVVNHVPSTEKYKILL